MPKSDDTQSFSTEEIAQLKNYRPRPAKKPISDNAVLLTYTIIIGLIAIAAIAAGVIMALHMYF